MNRINGSRVVVATLAAFVASQLLFIVLFGNPLVYDVFYTSAAGQSAKFVAVWNTLAPTPSLSPAWSAVAAMSGRKLASMGRLLFWTLGVVVYAVVADSLPGRGWRKGLTYGLAVWAIAFVFFGAFLHFNVLDMPIRFVLLEWVLEAIITIAAGITIAAIYKQPLQPAP